jgi:uncharacterized membrane protein YdjX (TVP38/TMEM64 family)
MAAGGNPIDEGQLSPVQSESPEALSRPSWIKIILLGVSVGVLLTVVYFSPLRHYLGHLREASEQIRGFGPLAPLVLVVAVAVMVGCGFPRTVFCVIAGMALGFWSGLLWAQLGTLIGNYALFLVVRAGARDWAQRVLGQRAVLQAAIRERGMLGVFVARQLPLPGLVVNLACALLPLRHRDFLLGTAMGQLPQAIPCTLIGAGALQASFQRSIGLIGLAVALSILAWASARAVLRRRSTGN